MPASLLLLLGLSIGAYVVTRPAVLAGILTPVLSNAVGGDVVVRDVRLEAFRTIRAGEIVITAPGWTGEAAEVFRAERVRVDFSLLRLLLGQVRLGGLEFGRVRIRAAERKDVPGEFNLLALRPDLAGGDEPLRPIPILIESLELETGLVGADGTFERSGERMLRGRLGPAKDDPSGDIFSFSLVDPVFGGGINGTWDERTFAFSAHIDQFEFGGSWMELTPIQFRQAAETIELAGRIDHAEFAWSPEKPFTAEFELSKLRLTIPTVGLEDRWARFRAGRIEPSKGPPQVLVESGRLRTEGTRVHFHDITGSIASTGEEASSLPVPARLSMSLDLGAGFDEQVDWSDEAARGRWIRESLRLAPFELSFAIDGFDSSTIEHEKGPVLEVPRPVASALATFGLTAWKLDVAANFTREKPTRNPDGTWNPAPIRSTGQAFLSGGSGAYRLFPYPLRDIKGHLTFELHDEADERFTVDYLTGVGLAGGKAAIRGFVERPGPSPIVDLTVTGVEIPIDQRLFDAFPPRRRKAFARIFSESSAAALRAAGLLPDRAAGEAEIDALRRRLPKLETDRADAKDEAAKAAVGAEIDRVRRMIAARPFELGGAVDFECRIRRSGEGDAALRTEGTLTLRRACAVIEDLPYPLVFTKGSLRFSPDSFSIDEPGLEAYTLEGGLARLSGRVDLTRDAGGDMQLVPELRFVGIDDRISPLLLAALPPPADAREGWPGRTRSELAQALTRLDLRADIDVQGQIVPAPQAMHDPTSDDVDVLLTVSLSNGALSVPADDDADADPSPFAAEWADALPPGLSLSGIAGVVRVERDAVGIDVRAETTDDLGSLQAKGSLSTVDRSRSLEVSLGSASAGAWLGPYLAARSGLSRGEEETLWDRLAPRGTFDATLRLTSGPEGPDHISALLKPATMRLGGDDVADGSMLIDGGSLTLDLAEGRGLLRLDGLSTRAAGGTLRADGEVVIEAGEPRRVDVTASGSGLAFESPFCARLLAAAAGASAAEQYRTLDPVGRFDVDLRIRRADREPLDWSLEARPATLAVTVRGARPEATFSPGGSVTATPRAVIASGLDARVDGGRIRLEGEADLLSTPRSARAALSLEAHSWTPSIIALLPPPVSEVKSAVGFTAAPIFLRDNSVTIRWDPQRGLAEPLDYAYSGSMQWRDGSFDAGLPFRDVDGTATIDFALENANPSAPRAALDATVRLPTLAIHGRRVTDAIAVIGLEELGRRVVLRQFDGSVAGGRISGEATYAVDTGRFTSSVRLVDAHLEGLTDPKADATTGGSSSRSPSRSEVNGRLSIDGIAGDVASRRGVGRITVRNARMADAPITMRLLQITQLSLPVTSSLSSADIEFFVRGAFAHFERFQLDSDGIQLTGTGNLDTRTMAIAANFRTRGRIFLLSDLIGAINDQLFDIEVTGPIDAPIVRLRPLPLFSRPASVITEER